MKLSICIPIMGQLEDTKGVWGCHLQNIDQKNEVELVVINNDSQDTASINFLERFIFPQFPNHKLINNPDNAGVVHSMNQCIENSTSDIIAILHNDLYVFEDGWNHRVTELFDENPHVGLAGFFGNQGIYINGGRMNAMSNMIEAQAHGERNSGIKRVAGFDGLSLIGRRAMFQQVGGFDEGYTYHHFYDRDMSLASHFAGWENWFIGVPIHHRSGVTANRDQYQTWIDQKLGTQGYTGDKTSYDKSEEYFFSKWKDKLPVWIA